MEALTYLRFSARELNTVCTNLSEILEKCLICINQFLPEALCVWLHCLFNAANELPNEFSNALNQPLYLRQLSANFARSHEKELWLCVHIFAKITEEIFSPEHRSLLETFDVNIFLEVLQLVCSMSRVKDILGKLIGQQVFVSYMTNYKAHKFDYRLHRGCATGVIALLRGSKANKNRFSAYVAEFSICISQSSDIFFQMQCVEILYRLHTHNRTLLLTTTELDDTLRHSIMSLPNDETLLERIEQCLDGYNCEHHANDIISFTVLRITCISTNVSKENGIMEICKHTTVYFTPELLVVLLPDGSGGNFTIPYEHIRSVRLSKEHHITLALTLLPPSIAPLFSNLEGNDNMVDDNDISDNSNNHTRINSCPNSSNANINKLVAYYVNNASLHIHVTQSTLSELRKTSIRDWIACRKYNYPIHLQMYSVTELPEELQESEKAMTCSETEEYFSNKNTMNDVKFSEHDNQRKHKEYREEISTHEKIKVNMIHGENWEESGFQQDEEVIDRECYTEHNKNNNDNKHITTHDRPKTAPTSPVESHFISFPQTYYSELRRSQPTFLATLEKTNELACTNHLKDERININSVTSTTINNDGNDNNELYNIILNNAEKFNNNNNNSNNIDNKDDNSALDRIHKTAASRVANQIELNNKKRIAASKEIKELINTMCRENARDRSEHETCFRNNLTEFRQAEAEMKEFAAECVNTLNRELEEVQQIGEMLQHECDKMLAQISEACKRASGVAETLLLDIREKVNTEISALEDELLEIISNVNPLKDLVEKLKRCNSLDLPNVNEGKETIDTSSLHLTKLKIQRL